ncbi:hypothetical protein SAMN05443247_08856 [Bradyrhizobium erythrophlei]|nr:hypothetical protein SAMN05443247_08856 [Bradyrhizobium erythrophlei]
MIKRERVVATIRKGIRGDMGRRPRHAQEIETAEVGADGGVNIGATKMGE